MKKFIEASQVENNGKKYWRVCIPLSLRQQNEGCTRRFFQEKKDAVAFADKLNKSRQSWSARLLAMPEPLQGRLVVTLDKIDWDVAIIERALETYQSNKAKTEISLADAIAKFSATKADSNHQRHATNLLTRFAGEHQGRMVHEITGDNVVAFIKANPELSNTTRRYIYAILSSFFRWAKKPAQGYVQANPCEIMDRPAADRPEIGYYTTEEIEKLLQWAYKLDRPMVSYIAIAYFAGPRKSELLQISPKMLIDDHFLVPASITKTNLERVVPITPVLRAWLDIDCTLDGWPKHQERFNTLARRAGVEIKRNALRHGYGTHNAPVLNIEETAKRMGDTPMICRRHYANPRVTRAELARYHSTKEMDPAKVLEKLMEKAA